MADGQVSRSSAVVDVVTMNPEAAVKVSGCRIRNDPAEDAGAMGG